METFDLEIVTPERQFFNGKAEALTIGTLDGELSILAHHEPMVAPITVGSFRLKTEKGWREAAITQAFVSVERDRVAVFAIACEWPEEIDVVRAQKAKAAAEEKLRQQQSVIDYRMSVMALARAMARLKLTRR